MDYQPQFRKQPLGFATKVIHSARQSRKWESDCVVPPIVTSTVFTKDNVDESTEFFYSRSGNPSRATLEKCLADMANAKFCFTYSSGLGAVTGVFSTLKSGDHLICGYDVFGGTRNLLTKQSEQFDIELDFVDATDLDELKSFIKKNTKMVIIESPTNPLVKVIDILGVSDILRSYKDQKIVLVVDNTFLTPYFQRPLELGADISLYSITKYLNGHTDVTMGANVTNCPDLAAQLSFTQKTLGIIPSPFDCYQVLRSFKTLALRLDKHSENSLRVAKFLENHPFVAGIMHPGLPSHPQHRIALKQSYGHSGMVAFYVKGNIDNTKKFMNSLQMILRSGSLGGPESLVSMPVLVSHASMPVEIKEKLGIYENSVRFSVGLEDAESIMADLDQALKKSQE